MHIEQDNHQKHRRASIFRFAKCISICISVASIGGCDSLSDEVINIDKDQFLLEANTLATQWKVHAPSSNGFQRTHFDTRWRAANGNEKVNLTSQARLVYVYATAYKLSGDEEFIKALRNAADFMLNQMRRSDEAGWYKSVDRDGAPLNKSVHTYGYSFAIFAMANAYSVTKDSRYLENSISTWKSNVWPGLRAAREWYKSGRFTDSPSGKSWSQNPFMHLFEALLELFEVTGSRAVWEDVEAMAKFLQEKLMQKPCGCLPEWYVAANFSPLDGDETRMYLGHQVEWAFLLSRAVDLGLAHHYLDTANSLLNFALERGFNRENGGLQATSTMDGKEGNKSYWWWAQAELMRATLHFAERHKRNDLYQVFHKTQTFARMHFIDLARKNWTDKSPYFTDDRHKIRQVIGYHWMAFYAEGLRSNPR